MAEGAHNEDATSNLLLHMLGTGSMSTTSIIHNTVSLLVAGIDSVSTDLHMFSVIHRNTLNFEIFHFFITNNICVSAIMYCIVPLFR